MEGIQIKAYFHFCTGEDHPVVFHNPEEFKIGMNLFAFSAKLFPEIKVLTFELMSNHLHALFYGYKNDITIWFKEFEKLLRHNLKADDGFIPLNGSCYLIDTEDYLRNVLLYINRNGFVVTPGETPFSYPWGANRFYFNSEAKLRHETSNRPVTVREKRSLTHSVLYHDVEGLFLVDGYVSPMSFCDIETGEQLFHDARQYFIKVSRNLEANREIASTIGERTYYLDEDLHAYLASYCSKQYGSKNPSMLPFADKIEVAKKLHYDFRAGNKQIARILKMELTAVAALFPH